MNPRIFTERLRGVIAGYFLSIMFTFLFALGFASQYILGRTVEWRFVFYFTVVLGITAFNAAEQESSTSSI